MGSARGAREKIRAPGTRRRRSSTPSVHRRGDERGQDDVLAAATDRVIVDAARVAHPKHVDGAVARDLLDVARRPAKALEEHAEHRALPDAVAGPRSAGSLLARRPSIGSGRSSTAAACLTGAPPAAARAFGRGTAPVVVAVTVLRRSPIFFWLV